MFLTRSEYDRGVNTFSPEGRLFQVSITQTIGYNTEAKSRAMRHVAIKKFRWCCGIHVRTPCSSFGLAVYVAGRAPKYSAVRPGMGVAEKARQNDIVRVSSNKPVCVIAHASVTGRDGNRYYQKLGTGIDCSWPIPVADNSIVMGCGRKMSGCHEALLQVEYAIEAIKLGSTAIGICTAEGVVLAVEKRITSSLMEPTTIEKIVEVDKHIAINSPAFICDGTPDLNVNFALRSLRRGKQLQVEAGCPREAKWQKIFAFLGWAGGERGKTSEEVVALHPSLAHSGLVWTEASLINETHLTCCQLQRRRNHKQEQLSRRPAPPEEIVRMTWRSCKGSACAYNFNLLAQHLTCKWEAPRQRSVSLNAAPMCWDLISGLATWWGPEVHLVIRSQHIGAAFRDMVRCLGASHSHVKCRASRRSHVEKEPAPKDISEIDPNRIICWKTFPVHEGNTDNFAVISVFGNASMYSRKKMKMELGHQIWLYRKVVEVGVVLAGCAVSGLMADSRTMLDRARVECQNHWFVYNERMSVESVAQAVSNLAIQFGDSDDDGGAMNGRATTLGYRFLRDWTASLGFTLPITLLVPRGVLRQAWEDQFLWDTHHNTVGQLGGYSFHHTSSTGGNVSSRLGRPTLAGSHPMLQLLQVLHSLNDLPHLQCGGSESEIRHLTDRCATETGHLALPISDFVEHDGNPETSSQTSPRYSGTLSIEFQGTDKNSVDVDSTF
ncbi:hypothetical protein PR048_026916 [Dryococelus australis]|uniref:Proteasome alpha-type subunits domain-containing protein n=1 Tax=Dryococelus australis TaxID=614101 RepID=A0ABQ9GML8_9NEOP|nr:hypothetical protein PR048_026916 [Dryococelus australis]